MSSSSRRYFDNRQSINIKVLNYAVDLFERVRCKFCQFMLYVEITIFGLRNQMR